MAGPRPAGPGHRADPAPIPVQGDYDPLGRNTLPRRTGHWALAAMLGVALLGAGAFAFGRGDAPEAQAGAGVVAPVPPPYPVAAARIVARYPHDRTAFTEGLIWHDGRLYESVGREGASDVRRVRLADGSIEKRATIPADQFGEGLAAAPGGRELVSLTWHGGIAHRWDARTLKHLGTLKFESEGWGLATLPDGRLVQSDGSATLRFLDPKTLAVRGRVDVTAKGTPVREVNELEVVDGQILANVWHTPYLIRIDPASGRVTGLVDLSPIVAEVGATDPEAVANGVAWDPAGRRLFVTGKLWPTLYEVTVDWP